MKHARVVAPISLAAALALAGCSQGTETSRSAIVGDHAGGVGVERITDPSTAAQLINMYCKGAPSSQCAWKTASETAKQQSASEGALISAAYSNCLFRNEEGKADVPISFNLTYKRDVTSTGSSSTTTGVAAELKVAAFKQGIDASVTQSKEWTDSYSVKDSFATSIPVGQMYYFTLEQSYIELVGEYQIVPSGGSPVIVPWTWNLQIPAQASQAASTVTLRANTVTDCSTTPPSVGEAVKVMPPPAASTAASS